jgi:hypothetical protein
MITPSCLTRTVKDRLFERDICDALQQQRCRFQALFTKKIWDMYFERAVSNLDNIIIPQTLPVVNP